MLMYYIIKLKGGWGGWALNDFHNTQREGVVCRKIY